VTARSDRFPFDDAFTVAASPQRCWEALSDTDRYTDWWPWLRTLDTEDGLTPGGSARGVIKAPLPYTLTVEIRIGAVVPGRRLDAVIDGDLAGPARLELAERSGGTSLHLSWDLELRAAMLRRLAVVGRPLMLWGHDRIVRTGFEQFRDRALTGTGAGR